MKIHQVSGTLLSPANNETWQPLLAKKSMTLIIQVVTLEETEAINVHRGRFDDWIRSRQKGSPSISEHNP